MAFSWLGVQSGMNLNDHVANHLTLMRKLIRQVTSAENFRRIRQPRSALGSMRSKESNKSLGSTTLVVGR